MGTLTERQKIILECVIAMNKEGFKPSTWQIFRRITNQGHEITEKQIAYDLGVIIRTKGTGVYSMKLGSNPKNWIYQESMAEEV
ncbi:hypothetical protein [Acinetobacter soli]|uniref:hypothetical protein n=1 Tax=Acinetobacter soli TaxID=487316 RepID=UPI000CE51BEF|nr:hypothetical protein [Acinetobacter soli]PPB85710.1 hypothetical protein AsoHEU7_13590 [Acinetobacter soli]